VPLLSVLLRSKARIGAGLYNEKRVFRTHDARSSTARNSSDDCPTCRLITPYLNALADGSAQVEAISQDGEEATRDFVRQMDVRFPVEPDPGFHLSKRLGVVTVPTLYVLNGENRVIREEPVSINTHLTRLRLRSPHPPVATCTTVRRPESPGAPRGTSNRKQKERHRRPTYMGRAAPRRRLSSWPRAKIRTSTCFREFQDALPVVPPTQERVAKMLRAAGRPAQDVIARFRPATERRLWRRSRRMP